VNKELDSFLSRVVEVDTPSYHWSEEASNQESIRSRFEKLELFFNNKDKLSLLDQPVLILPKNFEECGKTLFDIIESLANMLKLEICFVDDLSMNPNIFLAKECFSRDDNKRYEAFSKLQNDKIRSAIICIAQAFACLEKCPSTASSSNLLLGTNYMQWLFGNEYQRIFMNGDLNRFKILNFFNEGIEKRFSDCIMELYPNDISFPLYICSLLKKLAHFLVLSKHKKDDSNEVKKLFRFVKGFYVNNSTAVERLYKRSPSKRLTEQAKRRLKKDQTPKDSDYETYISVHKPYIQTAGKILLPEEHQVLTKVNTALQTSSSHLREEFVVPNQTVRKNVLTSYIDALHGKVTQINNFLSNRKKRVHDRLVSKRKVEIDNAVSEEIRKSLKNKPFSTEDWRRELSSFLTETSEELKNTLRSTFDATEANAYNIKLCCVKIYRQKIEDLSRDIYSSIESLDSIDENIRSASKEAESKEKISGESKTSSDVMSDLDYSE